MSRDDLAAAFERGDHGALVALARSGRGRVLRFLAGRLSSAALEEKNRAVRCLGAVVGAPGVVPHDAVLELLRRFLWSLNDESGAVPWGVPEAMGEVLLARPEFRAGFLPLLCGMLTEEEALQTGAIERGIVEALGRIGPEVMRHCPDAGRALEAVAECNTDPATREQAVRALAAIRRP